MKAYELLNLIVQARDSRKLIRALTIENNLFRWLAQAQAGREITPEQAQPIVDALESLAQSGTYTQESDLIIPEYVSNV